jgi:hypothetical protein
LGKPTEIAGVLQSLGNLTAAMGEDGAARAYLEECLALLTGVSNAEGEPRNVWINGRTIAAFTAEVQRGLADLDAAELA